MRETGERWKNVSMELRCVQSMLEEVVAYWRRWNTLADEFESWLDRAYGLLDLPEEDKMEYFQVISRVKCCISLNVLVVFVHNLKISSSKRNLKVWFSELSFLFVHSKSENACLFFTVSIFPLHCNSESGFALSVLFLLVPI